MIGPDDKHLISRRVSGDRGKIPKKGQVDRAPSFVDTVMGVGKNGGAPGIDKNPENHLLIS
ncbi:MAG: hypothetical protein R2861_01375 [Desulfobacterales bacterium]